MWERASVVVVSLLCGEELGVKAGYTGSSLVPQAHKPCPVLRGHKRLPTALLGQRRTVDTGGAVTECSADGCPAGSLLFPSTSTMCSLLVDASASCCALPPPVDS